MSTEAGVCLAHSGMEMNIARMAQGIGQLYDLNRKTTDELSEQGKELAKTSVRLDGLTDDFREVKDHLAKQDEKLDAIVQALAARAPESPPPRHHRRTSPWKVLVALVGAISASGGLGLWGYLDHRAQMKEKERIARERPLSAAPSIPEGK